MSDQHDHLLTETIARHFPTARVDKNQIDLGFGGLSIGCRVDSCAEARGFKAASLFFQLRGGGLGDAPIFASISGYAESDEGAIVAGGCNWACSFGPVLRAALAGEADTKVDRFDVTMDGQSYRLFVDRLDRTFSSNDGDPTAEHARVVRARLGGWPWLSRPMVSSGLLPLLPVKRSTILSVFVGSLPDGLTVEVKVNGVDWPGMAAALPDASNDPSGVVTLLRELAVLVPVGPPAPLQRDAVQRTLIGLQREMGGTTRAGQRWRGWRQHNGVLGAPLSAGELADLESNVGPLPPDYRQFLADVAASGAGPGYGLLAPTGEAQRRLAGGVLSFVDGASPARELEGVLALAHAGCGIVWYLALRGPHAGEVWCDARSSDGKVHRVAGSFTDWYRQWLDASVEDRFPWTAWDWTSCATASVVSQLLEQVEKEDGRKPRGGGRLAGMVGPGKLKLLSGGGRCFASGASLDPCGGCVHLATYWGLNEDIFPAGAAPLQGSEPDPLPASPAPSRGGWFTKWLGRFTKGLGRRRKGRVD
jgi:SMI1/KNR4 family protein SUKH-1